ncbi:MAG: efflux RND transporter periplasmic adaptor subunit [Acidobacteriia bacterium]|nr:efflux RND transporter periplasmic adaptor subunit [Terriglobia bacterium]
MADTSRKSSPAGYGFYLVGSLLLVTCIGVAYRIWATRKVALAQENQSLAAAVAEGPRVAAVTVGEAPRERVISLLGEARPFVSATLYAKVSGYLKVINVDKGDQVQAGQVLAVIESPELDHQYDAAVADARDKRLDAQRAATLVKRDMISKQDADKAAADADVADATVASLATQRSYEVIHAPFAGTVVARYADPGALVQNAATSQTSALPVVAVAQTDLLRVYVYPDQRDAHFIRVGDSAEITLPERPEVHLRARVARTSGELDTKTRTMLTEIDFDNRRGVILPGSFVQVNLQIHQPQSGALEIPSEALVMRGSKPFVAVITPGNQVVHRPVVIGVDEGPRVRIVSGLKAGERIAVNLGESVADGSRVQPVESSGY